MKPCNNKECPCGFWQDSGCSGNCEYVPHKELYLCKSYKPEQDELDLDTLLNSALQNYTSYEGETSIRLSPFHLYDLLSTIIKKLESK